MEPADCITLLAASVTAGAMVGIVGSWILGTWGVVSGKWSPLTKNLFEKKIGKGNDQKFEIPNFW